MFQEISILPDSNLTTFTAVGLFGAVRVKLNYCYNENTSLYNTI